MIGEGEEAFPHEFTDPEFDGRNNLFHQVRLGELTCEQAEDEAQRQGWASLSSRPDPANFDPLQKSPWSLCMAMAWIAWRNPDRVREWDNAWRKECWDWRKWSGRVPGPDGQGRNERFWRVVQKSPASVEEFISFGYLPEDPRKASMLVDAEAELNRVCKAKAQLWSALYDGDLDAAGVPASGGPRIVVPTIHWPDLVAHKGRGYGGDVMVFRHQPALVVYRDPVISAKSVITYWPVVVEASPKSSAPRPGGAKARLCEEAAHALWPEKIPKLGNDALAGQVVTKVKADGGGTVSPTTARDVIRARKRLESEG